MDQSDSRLPHKKLRRDCDCVLPLCYEEGYEAGAHARDYTSIYYDEFVEPPIIKEMVCFHVLLVERYLIRNGFNIGRMQKLYEWVAKEEALYSDKVY